MARMPRDRAIRTDTIATMTETVDNARAAGRVTETETETAITTDVARTDEISAPTGAGGVPPTWAHREATPAATRVGGEAEAETMTDVTHAATEMAITTGVGEAALAPGPGPHTVVTALAMTATVGTVGIALTITTMAEAVMATGVSLGLMVPNPPRTSGIDEPSLSSSLLPACELAS